MNQFVFYLLLMSASGLIYADCTTLGERYTTNGESQRSVEYFEEIFKIDLSEIGTVNDYPGTGGFYSAIANKVGLAEKIKTYVSARWPDVSPAGIIRYTDDCWIFFLFEFDRESKAFSWKRTLWVSHDGRIRDMGNVEPGVYDNYNPADDGNTRDRRAQ